MPKIRKLIFNMHLWIGLIFGLYFSFLGLTGSVLVFKVELARLLRPDLYHVASAGNWERIPYDRLVEDFRRAHPQASRFGIRLPIDATDTVTFGYLPSDPPDWHGPPSNPYSFGKLAPGQGRHDFHEVFVDPYTGRELADRVIFGPLFYTLHNLHAKLLFEDAGDTVHRVGVLFLLVLELSGIWLWFPKTKNFFQQLKLRTTVKWSASFKRVFFDLHNAVGFFSFLVLLPIVLTAASFVWPTAAEAVIRAIVPASSNTKHSSPGVVTSADTRPSPCDSTPSIDRALLVAAQAVPGLRPLGIGSEGSSLKVTMGNPQGQEAGPGSTTVAINPCSYAVAQVARASDEPAAQRISGWLLFVHNGQWGGGFAYYLVKSLWSLIGMCPTILTVTGLIMYLNKQRATLARERMIRPSSTVRQ